MNALPKPQARATRQRLGAHRAVRLLAILIALLLPLNMAGSAHAGAAFAHLEQASSQCGARDHEGSGRPEPGAQCAIACSLLAPPDVASVEPWVSLKPLPVVISVHQNGDGAELEPVPPPPRTVGQDHFYLPTVLIGDKS